MVYREARALITISTRILQGDFRDLSGIIGGSLRDLDFEIVPKKSVHYRAIL